ncbi:CopG family transcriptional regulator [Rhodoferax sp.]|uniref:ribbon-helix-helix domain-containing protein n=1 Tax=Rhodoferax sp. TaxID=50421 RepID=UPI00276011B4|nr:CopG family transcriptional regulator [Rhodoferax sp.]
MHRTQIYLQDGLYDSLKVRSRSVGVSISELIRRTLEKDIQKDPVADARAYFARLKPLESFAGVNSDDYVRAIRGKSRILRTGADT